MRTISDIPTDVKDRVTASCTKWVNAGSPFMHMPEGKRQIAFIQKRGVNVRIFEQIIERFTQGLW